MFMCVNRSGNVFGGQAIQTSKLHVTYKLYMPGSLLPVRDKGTAAAISPPSSRCCSVCCAAQPVRWREWLSGRGCLHARSASAA